MHAVVVLGKKEFFRPPGPRRFREWGDKKPPVLKHKGLRWVPVVEVGRVDVVPSEKVLTGPVDTINDRRCTRKWTLKNKTKSERLEEKQSELRHIESGMASMLFEMVDLLVSKGVVNEAEFSEEVRKAMSSRRAKRKEISDMGGSA